VGSGAVGKWRESEQAANVQTSLADNSGATLALCLFPFLTSAKPVDWLHFVGRSQLNSTGDSTRKRQRQRMSEPENRDWF